MNRKKMLLSFVVPLMSLMLAFMFLMKLKFIDSLENKTIDVRFQQTRKNIKASDEIVILLVDDASLKALDGLLGRWPWPREIWADVINVLTQFGAKNVLFDILFTEYQNPKDKDGNLSKSDQSLVEATASHPGIVHAMQIIKDIGDEKNQALLGRSMPEWILQNYSLKQVENRSKTEFNANNFYLPFDELSQFAPSLGVVEFAPDQDGVYRRTQLIRKYQSAWFPNLPLAVFDKQTPILLQDQSMMLGEVEIPLTKDGKYLIDMKKEFNTFSMSGVLATAQSLLQGKQDYSFIGPNDLKDKYVFVAVSAVGGADLKPTVLGPNTPGVYLQASILSNILTKSFIREAPSVLVLTIALIACFAMALSIFFSGKAFLQILPYPLFVLGYLVLAQLRFDSARELFPIMPFVLASTCTFLISYIYIAATEGRERRRVRKMLAQYVSPNVLKEVLDKKDSMSAEVGGREHITILFSDVRGFTSFSEKHPPEVVVEMLNYYLNKMVEVVFKYNGTLDKFIGDAVMAFWGAPLKTQDHAIQTTQAALEMIEKLVEVNQYFQSRGYPEFEIGIGLNTGGVILGNIGSEKKLDFTVIGDHVNLASRMEGLTKNYYSQLLISEFTYQELEGKFPCKLMDYVRVKGKEKPIAIYAPCLNGEQALVGTYTKAFQFYLNQEFGFAALEYEKLKGLESYQPHLKYLDMMIERCQAFTENPPGESWDGVYTMKSK